MDARKALALNGTPAWSFLRKLSAIPFALVWGVILLAAFLKKAIAPAHPCEGDRFADRAIYSDDPELDPLAKPH